MKTVLTFMDISNVKTFWFDLVVVISEHHIFLPIMVVLT